ncbi:MAG: xanthine dehydrogenase family protein molybdopterin-binding subunit, partial [Kofleriaceae bacterium]
MKPSVGTPIDRIDARLKVTGQATYAAETPTANVAHAVIVGSAIACGTVRAVDARAAKKLPGVIAILTPDTAPRLPPAPPNPKNPGDKHLQLLQDNKIWYADQPIAVVVADTLEHAQHAASLVTASYDATTPIAQLGAALGEAYAPASLGPNGEPASTRGSVEAGLAAARV